MILDEGMVWGGVLVTLCSVTSLSLGLVLVVEEGRRRSWRSRAREKISGRSFRLRAWVLVLVVGRWSRIAFPLPCLALPCLLLHPHPTGSTQESVVIARQLAVTTADWAHLALTATSFR